MPEDTSMVVTLASPVAIVAIVNWLKALGINGRWATLAAVVVALLIGTAEMYLDSEIYTQYSTFLMMGLAAAGFYDLSKNIGTAVSVPVAQGDAAVGRTQVERGWSLVVAPDEAAPPAQWENASGQKIGDAELAEQILGGATIRTTESQLREKQ